MHWICHGFEYSSSILSVLLCFIDPRVRKIRIEASSCPGIFSRTLRFYYVASSPGSPLLYLLDGHWKLHISSRSNFFRTGGAKMWRFSERMWQKTSQVTKNIFMCESVTFFPEMWQMWCVTFFVTEKSDKSDVTHPNLRREAGKKSG